MKERVIMKKLFFIVVFYASLGCSNGMNVQNNSSDDFGRRMTETLASINDQHELQMAAMQTQNAADREILMNMLKEQNRQMQMMQEQMQMMQAQHRQEQQELKNQVRVLNDQREIDRAKVSALERSNLLAQEANALAAQEAQEARAREQTRNARRAEIQNLIDKKSREIQVLDSRYIHPIQRQYFKTNAAGQSSEYDSWIRSKRSAERRIPQLQMEIADLQRQRDSL